MGLYNVLFGVNPAAPLLLGCLGMKAADVPRFRDCYIQDERIVIYTRTGGGNRNYYESLERCRDNYPEYFTSEDAPSGPWNCDLRKHPNYTHDNDDDFDSTYAYFYFSFPSDYKDDLEAIAAHNESHTPSEKWRELFKAMDEEIARKRAEESKGA